MSKRTCSFTDCAKTLHARGYCSKHYRQLRHSGELPRLVKSKSMDFWSKVTKTETCWLWTGYTHHGYGLHYINAKATRAHRISWESVYGEIGDGMHLDHICHNTRCVNPSHLRVVTASQNGQNRKGPNKNSTTGVRGVSRSKMGKPYVATVKKSRKQIHLGRFDTLDEAAAAVAAWRRENMPYSTKDQRSA